jgi:hypothetical protein
VNIDRLVRCVDFQRFASLDLKIRMASESLVTCVFCGILVSETVAFSALMEMPSSVPEEQLGTKCIALEDEIREISKSPVTQQGDRKS